MIYQIELNQQVTKKHQTTSLHLITGFTFMGIGAFTFLLGNADWVKTIFHKTILPGTILAIVSLFYGLGTLYLTFFKGKWLKVSHNSKRIRLAHFAVALVLALVFLMSQWWLAAAMMAIVATANLYAYFYEQKISQTLLVELNEEHILLPYNSRRKQLKWTEVERLILRHGNITIDCTDNFLYQWPVKSVGFDIVEFEDFCAAKIEANRSRRQSNDW
ncbi:MAG: hypothetical protein V4561_14460 [Bacteroidota bacterium]